MKEIESINGYIQIPKEYEISKEKRKLIITTPYSKEIQTMRKGSMQVCSTMYFRDMTKKPYIPDNFIELDKTRFKVKKIIQ